METISEEKSTGTLLRIQQETQRVKKRLNSNPPSSAGSASPARSFGAQNQPEAIPEQQSQLLIEPSTGAYFEDPVPVSQMSSHLKNEHEAFKSRLVAEVLGQESGDKVPMDKVVMLIWQFRDDPQVVKFMTRFVAKYSGSKHVFDGIEFYLPQLAHMIIHLEAEWDDAILESFALFIAQQSLHFALQLNWILQGAIEDYQPELPDGSLNPNHNPLYYTRCVKLLTNMERCVVYRRPRSQELQKLYEKGKITKQEYQILEHADRRFTALQITGDTGEEEPTGFGGYLLYKRTLRTACYKRKPWKKRWFIIAERMLNCYNEQNGRLVRSMPLEGATIEPDPNSKYDNTFVVFNRNFEFRMRASSPEDQAKWIKMLTDEAKATVIFGKRDSTLNMAKTEEEQRIWNDLTVAQRARYEFFKNERDFIRRVTDIAEELRFHDRTERKKLAPEMMKDCVIPPCVYVPLCNSTDIWRRVSSTLHKDTRVFNTNERCPVIMYFLSKRGEITNRRSGVEKDANLDVAEYMYNRFGVFDEDKEEKDEAEKKDDEDADKPFDENKADSFDQTESVEKTEEEIVEEMYGDGAAANGTGSRESEVEDSKHSAVWHDSSRDPDTGASAPQGNRNLQRFLRDSWISIPRKLATRLEPRRPSILDNATGLQSVPIIDGERADKDEFGASMDNISVGRSSILNRNRILLGDLDEGDIDIESIDRAKQIVSGGESWAEKSRRMLEETKDLQPDVQTEVVSLMSKSNDDLRQEVFVMQMIHYYKSVFAKAKLPLWLKTYRILSTSSSTGLIEVLVDATSIDGLKKADGYPEEGGLRQYFLNTYGPPDSKSFRAAQRNFMQSLAGYSLVSYLLGLKDRHNGNIMIDTRGHLIQIDFGFAMGMAPGHEFHMERAPFKLTEEYIDVLDGPDSECFEEFQRLFVAGFKEARKNSLIALGLVEIMMYKSNYPCFTGFRYGNGVSLRRFEKRLMLDVPDHLIEKKAIGLIGKSRKHFGTQFYDSFQQWSNGYAI